MSMSIARQTSSASLFSHRQSSLSAIGRFRCPSRTHALPTSSSSSSTTTATGLPAVQQQQQQAASQQQQVHHAYSTTDSPQQQKQLWQQTPAVLLGVAALLSTAGAADAAQQLHIIADLDAASAHSLESILRPLFAAFTVLYIIRITMTWYPNIDGNKFPWLLAYAPTEPFLKVTRSVIPLVGGVDITPIVWVALISFFNEILLGPQGILMLIQRESGAGLL